ncbi:MAG TPA: glycosyltransferase [Candidatus Binatus sp.]|nr:glycosyltransferase [Candidatus Binatus sp.]
MRGPFVVVTSGFPRRSETFLLNELLALEARGALTAIFATKRGEDGPQHPGCARLLARVEVLRPGNPRVQGAQVVERLGRRTVAAVHGYFAHRPAAVAAHAARRLGVPYGFSAHARDVRKVAPAVLAARAREAACVVACNGDVAASLARTGVPVELVPHGVDLLRFRPRPGPRESRLRLLAVGRLVEKKGFEVLLEAAARLAVPFHLRIVGEGPRRAALEAAIAAAGLADRVTLAGPATHAQLPREYARAHVVVVPSVEDHRGDRDGLPNVVLEALASGRVVVASDVGAVGSAVRDGRTGLLVPPRDPRVLAGALRALARQPDLRARLARAGRALVERRFELGRCAARLHQVLDRAYA